jgi:hypothetical protein
MLVPGLRRREIADHDSCVSIDDGHKGLQSCRVGVVETYERDTAADVINDFTETAAIRQRSIP